MEKIIRLCDEGSFQEALDLITTLISSDDTSSELYRIKGQAELELGHIETSINSLIESLRIDATNENALILIGNIYYREKNDFDTAKRYFDKVQSLNSKNYFSLNNLGGIYAKNNEYDIAIGFFDQALSIEPNYANALYGKALIAYNLDNHVSCFEYALKSSIATSDPKNEEQRTVHGSAFKLMAEAAQKYSNEIDEDSLYSSLKSELELRGKLPINVIEDNSISTFAKIEIAESHNRDEHLVKINKAKKGYSYYVSHELLHLKLICDARDAQENELFTSTAKTKEKFSNKVSRDPRFKKLLNSLRDKKEGLIDKLYDGLMLQMYNAPIDLFIEKEIFDNYPKVRPLQFLGLLEMANEALKGATDKSIRDQFPSLVRESNIIMSVTHFLQIQEFYGINLIKNIREKHLLKKGQELYKQYKELSEDKDPAEEYDLIRWWAEDLSLTNYFELVTEKEEQTIKQSQSIEGFMDQLEQDPFNLEGNRTFEDQEMAKFINSQKGKGLNMAALMYIKDALDHFSIISKKQVKDIGFEIAMLGRSGIDPNKPDKYSLSSVPNKEFTGWRLLSWMYAAWMDFEPDMVAGFNLDLNEEYNLAQEISL